MKTRNEYRNHRKSDTDESEVLLFLNENSQTADATYPTIRENLTQFKLELNEMYDGVYICAEIDKKKTVIISTKFGQGDLSATAS
jgi:hypothetical protein